MALDKVLKIYDEQGNPVDYDILAKDVKFQPDGKDLPTKLAEMEQEIEDAAGGGYAPPAGGIPKSDLASGVQSSLDKADTALQQSDKTELQNEINDKVDKVPGKGLSTNDYTDAEKTKLAGIAAGAQVNVINGIKAHGASTNLPVTNGVVELPEQTEVDLDDYYDKDEVDARIANKLSNVIVNNIPAGSVAIIDDTTTGGSDKVWSAGMGKRVAGREATDRQRIDAIVAILKKSVFTDDQTAAFAALDALANGIDSISFNASSHKFTNLGDTFTLSVVTDPSGKTAQIESWSSSKASVATVNNGVVTAVADGNAVITATTTDGKVAVCSIVVETIVITGISLNKSTLTLNGNNANETLIATTVPAGYESGVQWTSSDPTKATVDNNGKVTAVANTAANTPVIITASIGGQTATCQVTVTGVMQTFHISVGTLTNVTIEDGQGNAITNGQAVMEGSSLAITFEPAASHVIDALSVVMGSTSLSLADATDGTGGAKVITIQSVSGDIVISASATYQAKDYAKAADVVSLDGIGANSSGALETNSFCHCKIIPLDKNKTYQLTGYDWLSQGGTNGGYNMTLVTDDGNGGYRSLVVGTDITKPTGVVYDELEYGNSGGYVHIYINNSQTMKSKDNFVISIPADSAFTNVQQVYLAINYKWSNDNVNLDLSLIELGVLPSVDNTFHRYDTDGFVKKESANNYALRVFAADFGKSYSFSGYSYPANSTYYGICIAAVVGGVFRTLKQNEISNLDSFFSNSTYAARMNPGTSGSFTLPLQSAISGNVERICLIAAVLANDNADLTDFTLTKNN